MILVLTNPLGNSEAPHSLKFTVLGKARYRSLPPGALGPKNKVLGYISDFTLIFKVSFLLLP